MSQKEKKIIYFLGPSNSGKTTTIEKVIQELKNQQISCATIKFVHHPFLTLDKRGKDSSRHREAGALYTLNFAPKETAIIIGKNERQKIEDVQSLISSTDGVLPEVDVLLCESLNHPPANSYAFVSAKSIQDVDKYSNELDDCNILGIIGIITNNRELNDSYNGIPYFSALNESELFQIIKKIKHLIQK